MSRPPNKEKLLTDGLRLVHERGSGASSVRDITHAAGVTLRRNYEALVRALAVEAAAMRAGGADDETIARTMHRERRALAGRFRELTPEPLRTRISERSLAVYGDPLGPTIDHLRRQGKSWVEIIEGAARPGAGPSGVSD